MMLTKPYEHTRNTLLRDPETAAEYLNAALEEGDMTYLLKALRNVAEAQEGGIKATAEQANLNRESLYKMLSENGNPRLSSLEALLHTLGLKLSITVDTNNNHKNCA